MGGGVLVMVRVAVWLLLSWMVRVLLGSGFWLSDSMWMVRVWLVVFGGSVRVPVVVGLFLMV